MRIRTWALVGALFVSSGAVGCKRGAPPPLTASEIAQQTAAAIASGRVSVNREGVADLPANLQGSSANGKAYVKKDPDGTTWVLMPEQIDGPGKFKGWLYCSRPPGSKPATVKAMGPRAGAGGQVVDVTIEEEAQPGWYRVRAGG